MEFGRALSGRNFSEMRNGKRVWQCVSDQKRGVIERDDGGKSCGMQTLRNPEVGKRWKVTGNDEGDG